jgi:hypothetical protein
VKNCSNENDLLLKDNRNLKSLARNFEIFFVTFFQKKIKSHFEPTFLFTLQMPHFTTTRDYFVLDKDFLE